MAKKKKRSEDTPRLPAYSVYPPENAPSVDRYAYHLIKVFAGAMQALNGGILPMPTHWRDHLEDILNFHKVGKPPNPKVAVKHTETRKLMLLDEMERDRGETNQQSREEFLDQLCESRGYSERSQIYRDTKPYEVKAMASILADRLEESARAEQQAKIDRAKKIRERMEAGENLDSIFFDPDTSSEDLYAIRQHQTRGTPLEGYHEEKLSDFDKAVKWMSDGMNLHIPTPGYPQYFDLDSETEAFIKKRSKRKKQSAKSLTRKRKLKH